MIAMAKRPSNQDKDFSKMAFALQRQPARTDGAKVEMTLCERLERSATNSFFQLLWYRLSAARLEHLLRRGKGDFNRLGRVVDRAEIAWIYGHPLTSRALDTYRYLASKGMIRRELRLAVSCQFINEAGQVRINWRKERILQILGWAFVALLAIACVDLGLRTAATPLAIWSKLALSIAGCMALAGTAYPIILLGLAPRRLAIRMYSRYGLNETPSL